jgi:hypothetical protein
MSDGIKIRMTCDNCGFYELVEVGSFPRSPSGGFVYPVQAAQCRQCLHLAAIEIRKEDQD